jgi:hypothetical protein
MRRFVHKGTSMALIFVLLMTAFWPRAAFAAEQLNIEPPIGADLTLTADTSIVSVGDTVNFTVGFNLLSSVISGYGATRVTVFLPSGLDYVSSVVYIGGMPAVLTTMPAATPIGTSVVFDFDNVTMTPGLAQLYITANVSDVSGGALTARAEVYLQPLYDTMPYNPNEQTSLTLQTLETTYPTLPTIPIMPEVSRVAFNLNGGVRVGGGALVQAVPTGGSAVEPYVFRQGYVFLGWDISFYNVTQDITVTASWTPDTDIGMIEIAPPIYYFVEGHFINDRNAFTQFSHMPLIYYAERHVADFVSVEVNGQALTAGTHYVATAGTAAATTAIHLKASYLNTLEIGSHTLMVNFRGDISADAQFTVYAYVNTFYDVNSGDWFYRGVEAMNASELLRGVSDTRFDPHSYMTRGMVVTLLYRFAGEPSVVGFRNPFPDIYAAQYYTNAVIWAAANGIVMGHDNGLFAPHDIMTHEQFAAVLYRYQNALGSVTMDILMDRHYSDFDQIGMYARGAVSNLTMQGVFRDWPYEPENRFQPQYPVTRARVAAVMRLWIESIGW